MKAPAYLTRTGVFKYVRGDGKEFRELRLPEEVFSADSLETLKGAPVVVGHPAVIDTGNWQTLSVGHVGDDVRKDGSFVAASVRVNDGTTVQKILDTKELVELSCGYQCEVEERPGEYQGERYDGIQRNIRYNHVGLGPRDWGRAGNDVALRMDGSSATGTFLVDGPYVESNMSETNQVAPVPPVAAPVVPVVNVHTDTKEIERLRGENEVLKARVSDLEKASSAASLDARVDARLALRESARKVLPEADFTGKSDREVMSAVVAKAHPAIKVDGKSEDFLRGTFEAVIAAPAKALGELAVNAVNATHEDGAGEDPVSAARERMIKRFADGPKVK